MPCIFHIKSAIIIAKKIKKEASPMDSCDRRNVHMTMDTDYTAVSSVRKHPLLK